MAEANLRLVEDIEIHNAVQIVFGSTSKTPIFINLQEVNLNNETPQWQVTVRHAGVPSFTGMNVKHKWLFTDGKNQETFELDTKTMWAVFWALASELFSGKE